MNSNLENTTPYTLNENDILDLLKRNKDLESKCKDQRRCVIIMLIYLVIFTIIVTNSHIHKETYKPWDYDTMKTHIQNCDRSVFCFVIKHDSVENSITFLDPGDYHYWIV